MQVLYYMDVFVDLDKGADERSFVAKFDLNADFLGRYSKKQKDLKVTYLALDSVLEKREIKQNLIKNNVTVINIPDSEIRNILDYYDSTVEMVISNDISKKLKEHLVDYFRNKLGNFVLKFLQRFLKIVSCLRALILVSGDWKITTPMCYLMFQQKTKNMMMPFLKL